MLHPVSMFIIGNKWKGFIQNLYIRLICVHVVFLLGVLIAIRLKVKYRFYMTILHICVLYCITCTITGVAHFVRLWLHDFSGPYIKRYIQYICVYVCMLPAPNNVILKFYVLSDLKKCGTSASVTLLWTVKQCGNYSRSVFTCHLEGNECCTFQAKFVMFWAW